MTADTPFFIDGKPHGFERQLSVSKLLDMAGQSTRAAVLVTEDGTEHENPDELITIAPREHFQTKMRDACQEPADPSIRYAVNGEANSTTENPISLRSILQNAGVGAAIDLSDLDSYYLENTVDGRKYEHLDDLVTVSGGDNFLAIHVGSTPVA